MSPACVDISKFVLSLCNANRYPLLVWTYGNTFPYSALANLRRFQQNKGSIVILGGVPVCHPCVRQGDSWVDQIGKLGWDFGSQHPKQLDMQRL